MDKPSYKNNSTARHAEQLIQLKDFIEYCDEIISKNIKNLNYYEKWIFDEVLIRGKRLSSIANDKKCDRSYVYLSKKKNIKKVLTILKVFQLEKIEEKK